MIKNKTFLGAQAELAALNYLEKQGLVILERNYRCKLGEIDLIMQDGDSLVFVEVRQRREDDYGDGVESITKSKQNKIIRTATHYLLENGLFDKVSCRFDVVAINGTLENSEILWIKDAFWVKY